MPTGTDSPNPLFSLEKQFPFFAQTHKRRRLAQKLDKTLGLKGLSDMPASIPENHPNPYQSGREFMEVSIDGREEFESRMPKTGATIVVANHPFGAMDAVVASELTLAARPDSLIFGNAVMTHPVHEKWFLPLEILDESPEARRLNLNSMKRALQHLKGGGCLLIFPAGEVERWRWSSLGIEEGQWTNHLARLALKSNAAILPLAFLEDNPLWFHLPGALHPFLRLLALPRAFLAKRGQTIAVKTGFPLASQDLPRETDDFTSTVRDHVLRLANR